MMESTRKQVIELIENGRISEGNIDAALAATKVRPGGRDWIRFIDHLLAWLGGMAIAFAVMFFIAYNWHALGRFAKFGMLEALMIAAVVAYLKFDEQKVAAKVALLLASIFLGVLLALYGQTYQTGVDPWYLFFYWALLMLPWAIVARFAAIWVLWVGLINLSMVLYFTTFPSAFRFIFGSDEGMLWVLFVFNMLVLASWELLINKWQWLSERWAVRLLAIVAGTSITWLVIFSIFDRRDGEVWPGLVWLAWLGGMYAVYRKVRHDLFMLAGMALSAMVVVTSFLIKHILSDLDAAGFLLIALMIIGMGAGAAAWLRSVYREWQS